MSSRYRFALAPVAIGLAALLGHGLVQAQNYGPAAPPAYGQPYGQSYGQPDPGDGNVLGNPDAAVTDPPSRIATVTDMAGGLSFAPAGSDDWAAVVPNRPFTTGDRLWVDPGGRAELHAGTTAVRLGGASAATILNLDDRTTQIKLTQGSLQLRVRALPPDQPPLSGLRFEQGRLLVSGLAAPQRDQLRQRLGQDPALRVAEDGEALQLSLRPDNR